MSVSKREKLDRGSVFSSLLGDAMQLQADIEQRSIPLESIRFNPRQPRKHIGAKSLGELTESVRRHGVLEPVLVRQRGGDL